MSSRSRKWLFIIPVIGFLLIALGTNYYSQENTFKRNVKDFEERAVKNKLFEKNMTRAAEKEHEIRRQKNMRVSTAFKEGRCQEFFELLQFDTPLNDHEILLLADLYMRGKCREQNFPKAFDLYQNKLEEIYGANKENRDQYLESHYGYIAHIKFRLAALYWRGQGVAQDKNKAASLSRDAAIMLGRWLASVRLTKKTGQTPNALPPNIWHMSDADILENVTLNTTGPWHMPKPLIREIAWLKDIHKKGGEAYLKVGLHLLHGTGGFKKDPVMAYEWIYVASQFHDYGPAHYPRALLMRHKDYYREKQKFFIFSIDFYHSRTKSSVLGRSNNLLLKAAKTGDIRADKELLRLAKLAPDHIEKNRDIYFWMLRIHQHGGEEISEEDFTTIRKKLNKYDLDSTEQDMKENRLPSVFMALPKDPEALFLKSDLAHVKEFFPA